MFDRRVFEFISSLTPSSRGELEIADVHNRYIREAALYYDVLEGAWSDAGTFESLLRANELVAARRARSVEKR